MISYYCIFKVDDSFHLTKATTYTNITLVNIRFRKVPLFFIVFHTTTVLSYFCTKIPKALFQFILSFALFQLYQIPFYLRKQTVIFYFKLHLFITNIIRKNPKIKWAFVRITMPFKTDGKIHFHRKFKSR